MLPNMKTLSRLPSLSSSSTSPSSSTTITAAIRTLFSLSNPTSTLLPPPPPHSSLSLPQTLILCPTSHPSSNFNPRITHRFGFVVTKCVSSISSVHTVDWNEPPVSYSEDGGDSNCGADVSEDEDTKSSIPVRAFFFSTSVDLRRLVEQNKPNFIPPTSRMTNYVVLRFGSEKPDPCGLGANISGSDCCYLVAFQYGSIVLFNVRDHEVDGYLKIVEQHASGLLPEMRKDGTTTPVSYECCQDSIPSSNMGIVGGGSFDLTNYALPKINLTCLMQTLGPGLDAFPPKLADILKP